MSIDCKHINTGTEDIRSVAECFEYKHLGKNDIKDKERI
jgi:hypothetical protein